jgi:hypothetical protein
VPPLRHAMGLVDRKQRDSGLFEQRKAAWVQQALGRDVEQIEITGDEPALDRRSLIKRKRGVQHRCVDAGLDQARNLITHQRDQRRDHDAAALAQQRGQLVAQRLTAAGRHQDQAIAAAYDVPDNLFLRAAEAGQAEHGVQSGANVGGRIGHAMSRREAQVSAISDNVIGFPVRRQSIWY